MNKKFMTHNFMKICSEPRGSILDKLILAEVEQNEINLQKLIADGSYSWMPNVIDENTLFFALSQLKSYYSGGAVSDQQWGLASYYAYEHMKLLEKEFSNKN